MSNKRCVVCKKPWEIIDLFEGIYDNEMVMVCEECATEEKIPMFKKPSIEQLKKADKRYSVRERMEKLSGMHKSRSSVSTEQQTVQGNLNKLRMPEPKQTHPDILDNYYWAVNMARRRKKMTISQVVRETGIPLEIIEAVEKGKIPKDFEQTFIKLEDYFGIKLLKHHKQKVHFKTGDEEADIIEQVKMKMSTKTVDEDEDFEELDKLQKRAKLRELEAGELDLSNSAEIDDITLNDLVELKREKEKKQEQSQLRRQTEELLGDDIDIEFE
jgi:ribosome-binding protein aMBF1 (putative translation factor)